MTDKALVSVVIPAHNCAKVICRAVDSALMQDVPLEVIVINDFSTDDLNSVMEKYKDDKRVRYFINEKNLGASGTRNKGVSLAKGEFVAFLDADDLWREGKLRRQLELMKKTGAVLCTTARELVDTEGKALGRTIPVKEEISYRELLRHNSITTSAVLVKREVAAEFPMHHEDSHEDYIMWLEILQKYNFACGINEALTVYTVSTTGKSGSKLKSAMMTLKVYKYMGFGPVKSLCCFCSYAWNGVKKHIL